MAKTESRKTQTTTRPQGPAREGRKSGYEPPRLEKFEKLEKLVVSGE